jgi:hypothetical protein
LKELIRLIPSVVASSSAILLLGVSFQSIILIVYIGAV